MEESLQNGYFNLGLTMGNWILTRKNDGFMGS